jgi:2,3-bisphosphoglycerate-independent phosphoglycerate mutase
MISGNKVEGDETKLFSERDCAKGSLGTLNKGTLLMPLLMQYYRAVL